MSECEMCQSPVNWLCTGCGSCTMCGWSPTARRTVNTVDCCPTMRAAWVAKLNQS